MCFNAICNRVNKEATKMNEAINRVRELHKPFQFDALSSKRACAECSQINKHGMSVFGVEYPCPTIKELDGE